MIKANEHALQELRRMERIAMNMNPTVWESRDFLSIKIGYLNCQSLPPKFNEIEKDTTLSKADVFCFGESWITINSSIESNLQMKHFSLHLNSQGYGKGLAVYHNPAIFQYREHYNDESVQLTKMSSFDIDIIFIYRSKGNKTLFEILKLLIEPERCILICGDFNICSFEYPKHYISYSLEMLGFVQLIHEASHFNGGHLTHAYFRSHNEIKAHYSLYSPYYTARDHDALLIILTKG